MDRSPFDYVIIGGGSSGCVLAGELSKERSRRILLIESGEPAEAHPETLVASGYKSAFINDRLMHERFSARQAGLGGNRLFLGSGRGMGGSGSINAMVYTRGSIFDWDSWGVPGWGWGEVVPAFSRLEEKLQISRRPPTEFTEACIAAAEAVGFARKEDFNDGRLCGFLGYEWMNLRGEERRSAYVACLRPYLDRENLTVITSAVARRILLDHGRAVGVEYEHEGRVQIARAHREILLCAGALESPKLLLLSGVGPKDELAHHDIPLVAESPEVGCNLQDHPNVTVFSKGKRPTDCTWAQLYGFHRTHEGSALEEGEADTCYVFYSARSSFKEGVLRMLPAMLLPRSLYEIEWLKQGLRKAIHLAFRLPFVQRLIDHLYGVVVILGKPKSRGRLRLTSADPRQPTRIDPGYFSDPEDLETMVRGVERARQIVDAPALVAWGNRELIPGRRANSRKQIERFLRKNVMTTYHYAGTCRMGTDARSVVDPELRVRGTRGLRVCDASVIPIVPVSAMNAPSMVIGQRAAELVAASEMAEP
jgi:choline dehydrogenase